MAAVLLPFAARRSSYATVPPAAQARRLGPHVGTIVGKRAYPRSPNEVCDRDRRHVENPDSRHLACLLRLGGEWREDEADSENDREPDPPHGHLGGGRLPGSLAEDRYAH